MADSIASVVNQITSATSGTSTLSSSASIAKNFDSFLRLLTTQLQNQNPLEPLDTNQFTQQLVQFSQVEQQINMNQQLTTLIALQKSAQSATAINYVGATATVDGATARLAGGTASWVFSTDKPATATINIKSATGVLAYSRTFALTGGAQSLTWDGKGNDGTPWPEGEYTISVTAKDAAGQAVAVSTEVKGTVDGVDLTQDPPVLMIGSKSYALDKIKQVVRPGL
ncbi:MAG: flagellar biosynthesis protein FlgD [Xanthobacteraceae bacterium]|nr:flagellar biosynthesis protein FlgD [Xanthobacteraceae bacterium]PWB62197.1 MAG: flagellar biosynthesis protein FlgD [Bradyrhizobiaceae bacterium]